MWFGELLNLYDTSNGISLFLRLDAADVPHSSNSNKKATLGGVVGGVMGGLVAILAFVLLFLWCCKRPGLSPTEYTPAGLTVFTYKALKSATKNFSDRLGGGGFGSVFKGTLEDGSLVAVKKLEGVSQGEKQFCMEVSTIGVMQHVNLVRLRGFCTEGPRRLLVYEYMPNGCLSSFLFRKTQKDDQQHKWLDWKTRFGVAVGTARGIVYLHEKCRDCIIHCDIKPDNILLDSNFYPKLSDFGLAKLLGREYSKVLTTIRGTRGYLAPEWLSGLPITVKADVYSFGMTLLEIIAGRRNLDKVSESGELFFPAWAAAQISSGNAMEVLDKKLLNDADAEQVERAAIVGGWCIQDDEDARPSMSEVLHILEGIVNVPPLPPIPPSLQICDDSPVVFFWDKDSSARAGNNTGNRSTPWNNIMERFSF
jgi:serine/threonine protein kinase